MSLAGADNPSISPDGRLVAYHVRSADWEANGFDDEIWIVEVASRKRYQLTHAKGSSSGQSWSPQGDQLAFRSAREGATQIYLASPPSRDVIKVTEAPNGVNDFRWSPDGRRIAYTTSELFPKPEGDEPPEYHVVGNEAPTSTSLWVVDVNTPGKAERVIDGSAFAVDDISWSPDSRRIAFSAFDFKEVDTFPTYDLYVLTLADHTITQIVKDKGPQFYPVWSPDGTQVAFRTYVLSDADEYYYYAPGYIAVAPATGGASRVLTQDFDEHVTPLAWTLDGIYFFARQRTYQHLFRLNPATKAINRVTQPYAYVYGSFSFTPDGRQAAFMAQDATHYDELCVSSLQSFKPKRLTSFGDQIKKWDVGTREIIEWKSKDGTQIEGILLKPANFDRSKKYPLIVIIHGGPLAVDQAIIFRDMPYPAEMFLAKGAIVLRPNYRGSTGYGRKFRELQVRDEGKGPCGDILAGVDHLIAKGFVDPNRVGALGWSAGGYLSAYLSTTTDRFKAITVGEGVPDVTLYYAVGGGATVRPDYARGATAWDDPEYYRSISPITFVKNARTPTLIQHRESDTLAPTVGAHLFYRALKEQGVPVKLILYTGTGHVPSGLKQFRAVIEHNLDWMDQWIWGAGHDAVGIVKRELEARYEENKAAFMARDPDRVMRLRHHGFHTITPDGNVSTREQMYERTRKFIYRIERFESVSETIDSLTVAGDTAHAIVDQRTVRQQRLDDGRLHEVRTSVVQRESWIKTADGWLLWRVDQIQDGTILIDGKPMQ